MTDRARDRSRSRDGSPASSAGWRSGMEVVIDLTQDDQPVTSRHTEHPMHMSRSLGL